MIKKHYQILETACFFAFGELKARYKRSALGPLWVVLGTFIGVVGLGVVWGTILNTPLEEFVPMVTIGLIIWQFISGCITESSNVYYSRAVVLKNYIVPMWLFPIQLVLKNLFYLLHNLIVLIAVLFFFNISLNIESLYSLLGLCIVCIHMSCISGVIGIAASRYRDIEAMILAIMPLLFFLSPVLFKAESLGGLSFIVDMNPLSYYISIIRDPIMDIPPPLFHYVLLTIAGLIMLVATNLFISRVGRRIAFWM